MTRTSIKAKKKIQIPRKTADYCMNSLKKIPSDPASHISKVLENCPGFAAEDRSSV